MAKSARSSDRKRNNANLRAKIFGPASDARTERLSAKLQELAAKPKPEEDKSMDLDENQESLDEQLQANVVHDMDTEMKGAPNSSFSTTKKSRNSRIEKKHARRKPRNKVVFPTSAAKRKRIVQSKKKSV